MSFLKRALLAVERRKGKSIIIFIIFVVIANLVLAGFAIQNATESASVLARQKLGGQLTLSFDRQKAMQQAVAASGGQVKPTIKTEPITEVMAAEISTQENIIDYNYTVNTNGLADGFEPVITEAAEGTDTNTTNESSSQQKDQIRTSGNFVMPDVTVIGVSSTELTDAFSDSSQAKLLEGRHITQEDTDKRVAIIEKNLAEQNGLKVGSTIKITATGSDNTIEYTIVGIYEAGSTENSSGGFGIRNMPFSEPYNRIYVDYKSAIPLKTVEADDGTVTTGGIDSAVFFIDDPKNIEKVKEDAKSMNIDWNKFILDANDSAYQQMMGPIENVASFSMIAIYIVAIAGAVILTLLMTLAIRERMYETGVLLSMGEGKVKIIAQYVTEVLLIALLAFSLSVFTGRFAAQGIGNKLIQREVQIAQEQSISGNNMGVQSGRLMQQRFQTGANGDIQPIESINVQVSTLEVGKMMGAGLLIIILGTILPASSIMRYKPKTILTKAT